VIKVIELQMPSHAVSAVYPLSLSSLLCWLCFHVSNSQASASLYEELSRMNYIAWPDWFLVRSNCFHWLCTAIEGRKLRQWGRLSQNYLVT